jgi:hypothetical protein
MLATSVAGGVGAAGAVGGITTLAGASLLATTVGAGVAAAGAYEQGQYQSDVAKNNAVIQQRMADDALRRGEIEVENHQRKVAALKGEQRAAMGANGVAIDSGTSLGVLEDTAQFGALDALTIRSNAQREAFGMNMAAMNSRADADMASTAGKYNAAATLLSGAGSVGKDWYMYKRGMTNPVQPGAGRIGN